MISAEWEWQWKRKMLAFWEQSAYFQSVWGNTMFQTLMKIISAYPLKFQISSKVSGRKGWEPSQNSSWLVTGHLVWVVGTVFKSTSCIISSVNGSYGMLWMQLFLPPVKPEYCALAICGWGIDKISKHMEWLSLPQHLTLCSKFPSAAQWYLSEFIAVNGEWSWAPQSWAAEHLFFFSVCGSVLISFF